MANQQRLSSLLKNLRSSMTRQRQSLKNRAATSSLASLSQSEVRRVVKTFVKRKCTEVSVTALRSLLDSIESGKHLARIRDRKLIELGWSDHRWRRDLMSKIAEWKRCGVVNEEEEESPPDPPGGGDGSAENV